VGTHPSSQHRLSESLMVRIQLMFAGLRHGYSLAVVLA
jgi:hypothetical protein